MVLSLSFWVFNQFFKNDLPKRKVDGGIKLFSLRNFKLLQNARKFAKSGGRW